MARAEWPRRHGHAWIPPPPTPGLGLSYPAATMDIAKEKRKWLWPAARLAGLLPVTFLECECGARGPLRDSSQQQQQQQQQQQAAWGADDDYDDTSHRGDILIASGKACRCPVAVRSAAWSLYSLGVALALLAATLVALAADLREAARGRASQRMATKTHELVSLCDVLSVAAAAATCFLQAAISQRDHLHQLAQMQQVDQLLLLTDPPAVPAAMGVWLVCLVALLFADALIWTSRAPEGLAYAASYFPFYGLYVATYAAEALFYDEANGIHARFLALNEVLEASCHAVTDQQFARMPTEGGWMDSSPPPLAGGNGGSVVLAISGLIGNGNGVPAAPPPEHYASKAAFGRPATLDPIGGAFARRTATAPPPPRRRVLAAAVSSVASVRRLAAAHRLLCCAALSVTRRHGLALLANVLCLLLHLVITAYFLLVALLEPAEPQAGSSLTVEYVAVQCCWLAAHFGRMVVLVLPCSRATEEAGRTGTLVCAVLDTATLSSAVHKKLEMLSMQLLHHRVSFVACGLFGMNLTIIVSIMGAVTTYLVVLLQMRVGSTSAAANSTATNAVC